jgi:thioredoxin 1
VVVLAESVTAETFEREVLASEYPVLVDFWAPWCVPCRAIAPVLDRIAAERAGHLRVVKVNVDLERELANVFEIASIPTVLLFDHGEPVARSVGAKRKRQLEKALGLVPREHERGPGQRNGLLARLGLRARG